MPFSTKERKERLAMTATRRKQTIRQANDYMGRTGLSVRDLSHRIDYARPTLNLFLNERYHIVSGDDSSICSALEEFMRTHPVHAHTESQGKLYETDNVRLVRKYFYEALDESSAYYFRGAPGSQKTFVLQHLIAELNRAEIAKNAHGRRAFYVYCSQNIRPTQLMKAIAEAAGSISTGDTRRIFKNLRFDLSGRKVLVVIDESQHLDVDCLETLRELHDMPPHCGLLFAGSHEIENTFNRLDMEQWHSRLHQGAELPGVSEAEAFEIVRSELGTQSDSKIQALIKKCYATDLRKGREVKYISARTLFWSIKAIQKMQRAKGVTE